MGGWVQVSLGFSLENRPKIALNQYTDILEYTVYSVCTLLKVVGYYDLKFCPCHGWVFQKNRSGWGELYPICFVFLEFF